MNSIQLYQNPYVDVFSAFKLTEWKLAQKEGDVTTQFDKGLSKNVLSMSGESPHKNWVQLPGSKKQPKSSLGLTGHIVSDLRALISGIAVPSGAKCLR